MANEKNNKPRCIIVIPARYGSSRLPGKPLAEIAGKPMIQHVYESARQVLDADAVWVATDDRRIFDAVAAFGGRPLMTSPDHASGTDRLAEVARTIEAEIYVNVQGDEPLIRASNIACLIGALDDPSIEVATLCHPISAEEARDRNQVKVVLSDSGDALYFSRSVIPYLADDKVPSCVMRHVGVYAYRGEILQKFTKLPRPMIEQVEKVELLRLLAAGIRIRVLEVEPDGPSVDTAEDLERVRRIFAATESA
jgi:3-deoxy-D-manno-octulosonate cytidylyltransferase